MSLFRPDSHNETKFYYTRPDGMTFEVPEELQKLLELLDQESGGYLAEAIRKLLDNGLDSILSNSSVVNIFVFPEEVRTACEQYLLYFVEFLRDVGIEADASLKELAGKTLFSVTPKDKDEALDNIREALDVYLHLPTNRNITPFYSPESGIEVQRLSAQVMHLQSQLMLASAAYQQKELANQQQALIIQQQQSLIQQQITSGQVLLQSLLRDAEKDDAESVAGEIVKIKKWSPEGIPIEADLPQLIRWLKERFSRKQLPPGE